LLIYLLNHHDEEDTISNPFTGRRFYHGPCANRTKAQKSYIIKNAGDNSGDFGANGAGVAWNPLAKRYYAAMAGNAKYPLSVFDATGKLLSPPEQEAKFDIRGLWYNTDTKTLQANGYNDFGWAEYLMNTKGFPTGANVLHEGMNQPTTQSAGTFDGKDKVVLFFNEEGNVDVYSVTEGCSIIPCH